MDIIALAAAALEPIAADGIVVQQGWYDKNVNDTHVTLWNLGTSPEAHSDDMEEVTGGDVQVKVFSNENLGMSTLVHGRLCGEHAADAAITCKLRGWCDYKAGDTVNVLFEKRHFFDKETTNAIR